MARVFEDRYVAVAVGVLVVFFSSVAVALAFVHITNGVNHGLRDEIFGSESGPQAWTDPNGNQWSTAEVRHYFDDGSFHVQCDAGGFGFAQCVGSWGSAPCQKRYVGGAEGVMARHRVRLGPSCPGQIHA